MAPSCQGRDRGMKEEATQNRGGQWWGRGRGQEGEIIRGHRETEREEEGKCAREARSIYDDETSFQPSLFAPSPLSLSTCNMWCSRATLPQRCQTARHANGRRGCSWKSDPVRGAEGQRVNNSRTSFPESQNFRREAAHEDKTEHSEPTGNGAQMQLGHSSVKDLACRIWRLLVVGLQIAAISVPSLFGSLESRRVPEGDLPECPETKKAPARCPLCLKWACDTMLL